MVLVEVAAVRVAVDLEERPVLGGGRGDRLDVDLVRLALPISRPVRWPMQSTCGFSIAATTRSVIFAAEIRNEVWTLATTQSSRSSTSGS